MAESYKKLILLIVAVLAMGVLFMFDPIAQDPRYHLFADTEGVAGIPNFWNVVSNASFLVVGAFGLWRASRLTDEESRTPYRVLCMGVMLVALGSGYYHYAPSNQTLLWDRLPMTVAFMALFALILGESVIARGRNVLLWGLVGCGVAAAFYWSWTEQAGRGDLRPYAVVQFLPILLMPLIILLFPRKYLNTSSLVYGVAWYLLAKALEHYDHQVQALLGVMGGHPLKHVAAAVAAFYMIRAVSVVSLNKPAFDGK